MSQARADEFTSPRDGLYAIMHNRLLLSWLIASCLLACNDDARPTYPDRRAGRGEPCLVLNDCKEPLLCLSGRCLDAKPPVAATNKQCVIVACRADADCCTAVQDADSPVCQTMRARCDGGDPGSCTDYQQSCTCTRTCQDHQCTGGRAAASCTNDYDCWLGSCIDGACRECATDDQCAAGRVCTDSRCVPGCAYDGQCGALESCKAGRCEARGCVSDRECIGLLQRRDAVCKEDECVVACNNDSSCSALSTCVRGVCRDLGCASDAECQGLLPRGPSGIALCIDASEVQNIARGETPAWSVE